MHANPVMAPSSPARLAVRYTLLVYLGSWALWGLAWALRSAPVLPGVLQVLGTLVPLGAAYLLFPQLRACGLAGPAPHGAADARDGFWAYAFGPRGGWAALAGFAVLFVWRWAMFRLAFGFPATFADALLNAARELPLLLLGGGLEEVGWRGCLQPALERACLRRNPSGRVLHNVLPPLVTGVVWGLWHLPLFLVPGSFQAQLELPWGLLGVVGVGVALSCSFGALARLARGSVLPCVLGHAWYNAMLVGVPAFSPVAFALFAIEAAAGLAVLCLRTGTNRPTAEEQPHGVDRHRIV